MCVRKDYETLFTEKFVYLMDPIFCSYLLGVIAIVFSKSEDKYVVKVFNWSEVHLSEMTCYKIHTLEM